jgi:hypothetical protein
MGNLISTDQLREITNATKASEVTILRRVVGLPVRGAAGPAVDRELSRRGLLLTAAQSPGSDPPKRAA